MNIICRRAVSADDLAACMDIRDVVFVGEQKVPADLERDGLDDQCLHYVAEMEEIIIGTARVMILGDMFKFQRVAVMPVARGAGIGGNLMDFMMKDLAKRDDAKGRSYFLSSQTAAVPFYERLGFETCSDQYEEAGIMHQDMSKAVI